MPRKLITIAVVVSIVLVVTVLVTYAHPLRNWLLTRDVKVLASPVNSSAIASPNRETSAEGARSLALQPEALKVAKRIGAERFKSRIGATLVVQGA